LLYKVQRKVERPVIWYFEKKWLKLARYTANKIEKSEDKIMRGMKRKLRQVIQVVNLIKW
jgi:hypothetical protein